MSASLRARRRRWAVAVPAIAALAVSLLVGCGPHRPAAKPSPTGPAWQPVTVPASGDGRISVRDVTACAGQWYAVGGYLTSATTATPAIWSSADGTHWSSLLTKPISLYGRQSVLSTVACSGATVVAVGGAAGGVHGNPRTSTWLGSASTGLTELPSQAELFGGDNAGSVGQLTAGAHGYLIGGGRTDRNGQAGAAVWWSADGNGFQLVDGDPALESDATGARALRGVLAVPDGFVAVGSRTPPGSALAARQPQVWRSPDGLHWSADQIPATGLDTELQAATEDPTGLLVAGVFGTTFAVWRDSGSGWQPVSRFGQLGGGTALPVVSSVATAGNTDYLVAGNGTDYALWTGPGGTGWVSSPLPATVTAGADRAVNLAATDGRLLLSVEDGTASHLWLATLS